MNNKLEDVEQMFADFQERHDVEHGDYLLLAKRIMEKNQ